MIDWKYPDQELPKNQNSLILTFSDGGFDIGGFLPASKSFYVYDTLGDYHLLETESIIAWAEINLCDRHPQWTQEQIDFCEMRAERIYEYFKGRMETGGLDT